MSIIRAMLDKLFPKTEYRVLMLGGFDSPGKTTALYKLKLGEVVTTIPTIGFNVETVETGKASFTMWDVGGREKMRPLWRHYFQNTDAIIFVVNCQRSYFDDYIEEFREELAKLMNEDELRDAVLLVWANKQDLPGAVPVEEVVEALQLHKLRSRAWHALGTTATVGEGLHEGMAWIEEQVSRKGKRPVQRHTPKVEQKKPAPKVELQKLAATQAAEAQQQLRGLAALAATISGALGRGGEQQALPARPAQAPAPAPEQAMAAQARAMSQGGQLIEWLEREDDVEPTLQGFQDGSLADFGHRERLLVAWALLQEHGRKKAMKLIFEGAKALLGSRFHETTLYFWVHMVHYAIEATKNPLGSFQGFLLLNPQLANNDLVLDFYSQQVLWQNEEAGQKVLLPDKKGLPSLVAGAANTARGPGAAAPGAIIAAASAARAPAPKELSDEAYLELFKRRALPSWGHEPKLRAIWVMLREVGRPKGGTDQILSALQGMEGSGYNLTLAYFWVQMVTYFSKARHGHEIASFSVFISRAESKDLLDPKLPSRHYTDQAIESGVSELVLPDKKPLPSVAPR